MSRRGFEPDLAALLAVELEYAEVKGARSAAPGPTLARAGFLSASPAV